MNEPLIVVYDKDGRRASHNVTEIKGIVPQGYEIIDSGSPYRKAQQLDPLNLTRTRDVRAIVINLHNSGIETDLDELVLEALDRNVGLPGMILLGNRGEMAPDAFLAPYKELLNGNTPLVASARLRSGNGYIEAPDRGLVQEALRATLQRYL